MKAQQGEINITLLVDNKAKQGLLSEHGFAAWIEFEDRRLLFDTGQGPALESNVGCLDIDLRTTDVLVLSHGHYDHTGGVPLVIERAPAVQVYAHPAVTEPRYAIREGVARSIAMAATVGSALESLPTGGMHRLTRPLEVADGVALTGPIPRLTDYEDTGGPFFTDAAGAHPDPIPDDLALWLRTERGLVVVTGCSHAGLINTLHHVRRVSGEPRLHAVLGGFHLLEAGDRRIERTMAALEELDPDLIVPCHCTGDQAVEKLRRVFRERVAPGSAGDTYTFGVARAL